jgi:hypothetical protein
MWGRKKLALERIRSTCFVRPNSTPLGRNGFVIVRRSITGTPTHWFRYHREKVWIWTTNKDKAELFPTRDTANKAVMNCSVWYESFCEVQEIK